MFKSFGEGEGHRAACTDRARQGPSATARKLCAVALAACGTLIWSASSASAVPTPTPSLVQTIDTSAYMPSSPDPAGIAYLPAQDRLVISDSEVDEMPLFQGFNLFTGTRTGLRSRQRGRNCLLPGALRPGDRHSQRQAVHRGRRQGQGVHRLSRGPTASTGPPTTPGPTSAPCPSGATIPRGSPTTRPRATCSSATASGSRSTGSTRSTGCSAMETTSSPTSTSPSTEPATARAWGSIPPATGSSAWIPPRPTTSTRSERVAPCSAS